MLSSSAAGPEPVSTSCSNSSSSATNSCRFLSDRVARSGTSAQRRSADANAIRSRSAKFSMQASARPPIPRVGDAAAPPPPPPPPRGGGGGERGRRRRGGGGGPPPSRREGGAGGPPLA